MEKNDGKIRVVGADVSQGNVAIHFSDNTSVLFHAQFLSDVREDDGNIALVEEEPEEDL